MSKRKFSSDIHVTARVMRDAGASNDEIASRFNVSRGTAAGLGRDRTFASPTGQTFAAENSTISLSGFTSKPEWAMRYGSRVVMTPASTAKLYEAGGL